MCSSIHDFGSGAAVEPSGYPWRPIDVGHATLAPTWHPAGNEAFAQPPGGRVSRTWRNPFGKFGLLMFGLLVVGALAAPLLAPYDPDAQLGGKLLGPSSTFWLGTDELGRDLLSRLIWGARPSLLVATVVVVLGGGVGILAGLLAGFLG